MTKRQSNKSSKIKILKKLAKKRRKGIVIKKSSRQIGKSNVSKDIRKKAMRPGKRISKNGKIYYEYRKNRTDLKKKV